MDIKLVLLLKSGGVLVKDIHTTPETINDDIIFVDKLLDNLFDAMNTGSIIRFKDDRVRDFIVNCKYVCWAQYYIAADENEYATITEIENEDPVDEDKEEES